MISKTIIFLLHLFVVVSAVDNAIDETDLDLVQSTVGTWIKCSFGPEPSQCLEQTTIRQLKALNAEMGNDRTEESPRDGKDLPPEEETAELQKLQTENRKMMKSIELTKSDSPGLIDEMTDFLANGFLRFIDGVFGEEDQPDRQPTTLDNDIQARGHKKKYLKKQNKHLKIILILMLIKNKIKMFLHKFQFLVQLKFLGIALANLLINLIRLWLELKKKHKANKVIYYEKSHHQHHYDNEHIHDEPDEHYGTPLGYHHYAHHEEEGGGGIWPWSRTWVEDQRGSWTNPGFRRPGSHNLVYMNQRPIR